MIRGIFYIILFLLFGAGLFWLSQNSGSLSFSVLGYQIDTTVTIAVIAVILVITALQLIFLIIGKILNIPTSIRQYLSARKKDESIDKLSELIISIESRDVKKSQKLFRTFCKYTKSEKLKSVLSKEIASVKGEKSALKTKLLELTKYPETKISAYIGLIEIALQDKEWQIAINYCEELWEVHKDIWVAKAAIRSYIASEKWNELLEFLKKSKVASVLGKPVYKTLMGTAVYKISCDLLKTGELQQAHEVGMDAYKVISDFLPLIKLLVEIRVRKEDINGAFKLIRNQWEKEPHIVLTQLALSMAPRYTVEKFLDMVKNMTSSNEDHYESHVLLAKAALDSEQFDLASHEISEALGDKKKFRACVLMAEFCQKTHGNATEILDWLHDAINAEHDMGKSEFYWDFDAMEFTKDASKDTLLLASI